MYLNLSGDKDLVKVLMSVSSPHMKQQYSTRVLHLFNKLFQAAEKSSTDPSLNSLCSSMGKLAEVESEKLQAWLRQIIIGPVEGSSSRYIIQTYFGQVAYFLTDFLFAEYPY